MKKTILMGFILLGIFACNKENVTPIRNLTLKMKKAQTAMNDFTLELVNVEDSRCPSDELIQCVWAGEAKIYLFAESGTISDTLELVAPGATNQNQMNLDTANFMKYQVILHQVSPYPETTDPIPLEDYQVDLTVVK